MFHFEWSYRDSHFDFRLFSVMQVGSGQFRNAPHDLSPVPFGGCCVVRMDIGLQFPPIRFRTSRGLLGCVGVGGLELLVP